jgi:DNA-binding FrmR family transcriptional regulator
MSAVLANDTLGGYIEHMNDQAKTSILKRFNRIEGQVRGLASMVTDERYCIDIVTQISAVKAALQRAEEELLREHVSHCVEGAIKSGNKSDQRKKITELMQVFSRSRG